MERTKVYLAADKDKFGFLGEVHDVFSTKELAEAFIKEHDSLFPRICIVEKILDPKDIDEAGMEVWIN